MRVRACRGVCLRVCVSLSELATRFDIYSDTHHVG